MTNSKKLINVFFALFLCAITACFAFEASAYGAESGTCGKNLTWYFDGDDTLTISGSGNMSNYDAVNLPPWYHLRNQIEDVVVKDGVKSVGALAFLDCTEVEEVTLAKTVESVKYRAFYYCGELDITILNPRCDIVDTYETIPYGSEINGYVDSTAHDYALKYGLEFEAIYCNHAAGYETVVQKATTKKDGYEALSCRNCGEKKSGTVIAKANNFTLSDTDYTYTGYVKKPVVTVRDANGKLLKEGRDYNINYLTNRKSLGEHKVQVKLCGDYKGSKTLTFNIELGKVKKLKASQATKTLYLDWDEVKGAYGYRVTVLQGYNVVYSKNVQDNDAKVTDLLPGTKYKVKVKAYRRDNGTNIYASSTSIYTATKPTKGKITKVTVKDDGSVNFRWEEKACTKYQLRYSENADFSNSETVKVDNDVKYGKTLRNLESGKTYYVKVRAYKSVEGVKYYGKFSNTVKVTIA